MTILRARPGQEVKLGEKVYTANEQGLVLVQPDEVQVLRAHGFAPVLNTNEVRDPQPTDDGNSGHSVGSTWNNRVADTSFACVNSSPLAAEWKKVATREEAFALFGIKLPPAESPATPDGGNAEGDADQPSAAISDPENDGGGLVGSSTAPSTYLLEGGNTVQLGQVVAEAHKRSGLSVADWNALDQEERDTRIQLVVDDLPLAKTDSSQAETQGGQQEKPAESPTPAPAADTDSPPAEKPEPSAEAGETNPPPAQEAQGGEETKPAPDAGPAPHANAGDADQPKAADAEQVSSDPAPQEGEAPAAPASTDAPEKSLEEKILDAALTLDPKEDAHWTKAGLPNVNVLQEKLSTSLTRDQVTAVLGANFTRESQNPKE